MKNFAALKIAFLQGRKLGQIFLTSLCTALKNVMKAFQCSNSTTETEGKSVKYVQSKQ